MSEQQKTVKPIEEMTLEELGQACLDALRQARLYFKAAQEAYRATRPLPKGYQRHSKIDYWLPTLAQIDETIYAIQTRFSGRLH